MQRKTAPVQRVRRGRNQSGIRPSSVSIARGQRGWSLPDKSDFPVQRERLAQFTDGLAGIFTKRKLDDATLTELEDLLITADLGTSTAARLTEALAKTRFGKEVTSDEVRGAFAADIDDCGTLARQRVGASHCAIKRVVKATI